VQTCSAFTYQSIAMNRSMICQSGTNAIAKKDKGRIIAVLHESGSGTTAGRGYCPKFTVGARFG